MPTSHADAPPAALIPANEGSFGLLPATRFRLTTGACQGSEAIPQALWFFRHEPIAVPLPGLTHSGYSRSQRAYEDVASWHAATPPGSALDFPPLVWTGADWVAVDGQLASDGTRLQLGDSALPLKLAPRHPLNRAYFDDSSTAFFCQRRMLARGQWDEGRFVARTLWPRDFRLPGNPALKPLASAALSLRERVREQQCGEAGGEAGGEAKRPFSVETLWQRADTSCVVTDRPVLAFILNGAQGDDDEAHGGHFAAITGRIGPDGAMHDWLVANYYTLDSESEKGIIAAPVTLDNYLADLNSGQAWYRPSSMLVAVLRDQRTAAHIQSAQGRVFNQFYRHQFSYHHACNNCAGITVSTLRALDWQVPVRGAEGWLKALASLPVTSISSGSLKKGKAVFDYLTEDQTRLYPAAAFEEIGVDLLNLAQGSAPRTLSEFEKMLAEDIEALLLVHIPQLPSGRVWGTYPIVNSREYGARVPKKPEDRQIVPVGPRPFPKDFIDPQAPHEPPLRSDYAVAGVALLLALLVLLAFG
jgi:hypothetical protein